MRDEAEGVITLQILSIPQYDENAKAARYDDARSIASYFKIPTWTNILSPSSQSVRMR
jgi:hypothetical protein